MMQGWSAPPPGRAQGYRVACAGGHWLSGQRTEGYQALRCPTCGEGIFVLPRSPLPEPVAPAPSAPARAVTHFPSAFDDDPIPLTDPIPAASSTMTDEVAEVEIDWVDDGPEVEAEVQWEPTPAATPAPPRVEAAPAPRPAPRKTPPRPATPPPAPRPPWDAKAWAIRHRNALLVAGVLVLISGAVLARWRRQRLEELPRIAEIGRTEGLKRLDAGDFHAAKKLLADAASAVDSLGGKYEGADSIRQGALEAAILTDLVPEPLEQLLEGAATASDPKDWSSRFAGLYRGRSIVLETTVMAVPDPARPGSPFEIDARVYFGRGPRPEGKARFDLTGFALFESINPKVGESRIIGARLGSLDLDIVTGEWVFTLEPDSGVLITHRKALEVIGWPPFEPVEEPLR
jgi:hypothetical protein